MKFPKLLIILILIPINISCTIKKELKLINSFSTNVKQVTNNIIDTIHLAEDEHYETQLEKITTI